MQHLINLNQLIHVDQRVTVGQRACAIQVYILIEKTLSIQFQGLFVVNAKKNHTDLSNSLQK